MPIHEIRDGDIFAAPVECLVNPVNTIGVMGKGLAAEFKSRFGHAYFAHYRAACHDKTLAIGKVIYFDAALLDSTVERRVSIVDFPTKRHWSDRSSVTDVRAGLISLVCVVLTRKLKSIAVPALGCGLGGLDWETEVRPLCHDAFESLPGVDVYFYIK